MCIAISERFSRRIRTGGGDDGGGTNGSSTNGGRSLSAHLSHAVAASVQPRVVRETDQDRGRRPDGVVHVRIGGGGAAGAAAERRHPQSREEDELRPVPAGVHGDDWREVHAELSRHFPVPVGPAEGRIRLLRVRHAGGVCDCRTVRGVFGLTTTSAIRVGPKVNTVIHLLICMISTDKL